MGIRTHRLLMLRGYTGTGTDSTTTYTVPAGKRTIVRSLTLTRLSDVACDAQAQQSPTGAAGSYRTFALCRFVVGGPPTILVRPWFVLEAGEVLAWRVTTGVVMAIAAMDGVELDI